MEDKADTEVHKVDVAMCVDEVDTAMDIDGELETPMDVDDELDTPMDVDEQEDVPMEVDA